MLQITYSNRLEPLLGTLLAALATTPAAVFQTEQIIIPSAALQRSVTLAITERSGICANVRFSYLSRWIWEQIGLLCPTQPGRQSAQLTSAVLAWRITAIFNDRSFTDAHPRLASWLSVADPVMRFDLATRTAGLLDQACTYRPDWIAQWSRHEPVLLPGADTAQQQDHDWQAALWQRILLDLGAIRQHLTPTLLQALHEAINQRDTTLPMPTIHLVCLSAIAPVYLAALRELGRVATLHLYVLSPSRALRQDEGNGGNRLLAAWGKTVRAQIALLHEAAPDATINSDNFVTASGTGLLARLQNAILEQDELAPASITMDAADRSIECHRCHSLTRELEVLQDQLLALFAGPNPPRPCDILVVTPNLEDAAALIDTVFGSVPFERRIPYTITGRAGSTGNPVARALLGLLALSGARVTASDVHALLQQPVIGRRFGIDVAELEEIHEWLGLAGIRWGLDEADPASAPCSFDAGMHRLFLGYALPTSVAQPFAGRVPAANIEGGAATILGRFWLVVEAMRKLQLDLGQPRHASDWQPFLATVVESFLTPDNDQLDDLADVHSELRTLNDQLHQANFTEVIPEAVVRSALTALLDESTRGGIPTGTVTFAGMAGLRHLPYRVLCAIGLNDGAFPAAARPAEIDLMALVPRAGDRVRSADDRNLFLDLILCARDRLYLSYTGRGVRDNASLPPSVLVDDLLDYLAASIATDESSAALASAHARLCVAHPLQPFSANYFIAGSDARLRSANDDYCSALKHALTQHALRQKTAGAVGTAAALDDDVVDDDNAPGMSTAETFFRAPLPAPDPVWRTVSLVQLKRFFANPCRYLLQERLGLKLDTNDDTLQDDEPFVPDFIGASELATRLLPLFAQDMPLPDIAAMAHAGIELPPGPMGDAAIDMAVHSLQQFCGNIARASIDPYLPPHHVALSFDLDGEAWQLSAAFGDLRASGLVRSRCDDVRTVDYLSGWIDHLALNASVPKGVSATTTWISRNGQYTLSPCTEAMTILGRLLRLYRQGLSAPLHFFPKSAWMYVAEGNDLGAAAKKWFSSSFNAYGEDGHVAYRLALRGVADPIDDAFEEAADTVFGSLLPYLKDDRL
ncbi:exodeoxyribonuclease V subunit gamma [Actimicrobium sp. CCI2.3]|uniref:exodeoxyribonuclease V subunit gamma n=1 Tax=Actimicrobium sp. CCI2.3 TaxID=3048616 RepID=UPI002AB43E2B|nr:exodeoxyribonuclease V subunit gamma [Actimicrobium sp. CCI2.3]MDY7574467.1 exodeoxyribonuclease V subunit gamma [Actimicrobium sp. CCI2.3]MEB0022455.1 exodeoxyribonuclease V subunit gamma [Actimicrobium sp. CCI2.3]